jgi:hypothetical protein
MIGGQARTPGSSDQYWMKAGFAWLGGWRFDDSMIVEVGLSYDLVILGKTPTKVPPVCFYLRMQTSFLGTQGSRAREVT